MTKWIMVIDDSDEKENKLELCQKDDGSFFARFMTYTGNYIDFPIKPIKEPAMVVTPTGEGVYITRGHIDAMIEFEEQQKIKEYFERFSDLKMSKREANNGTA